MNIMIICILILMSKIKVKQHFFVRISKSESSTNFILWRILGVYSLILFILKIPNRLKEVKRYLHQFHFLYRTSTTGLLWDWTL